MFLGPEIHSKGCYGASMVTLPGGNEAVIIGCEDFISKGWDSKTGYGGRPFIIKLTFQGQHLKWVLLAQSLRYIRTEAIAMMIPDSMTDCKAKCKYSSSCLFEEFHGFNVLYFCTFISVFTMNFR